MRYYLISFFTILIIGCTNGAYAAKLRNFSIAVNVRQDTSGNAKRPEKKPAEKDKSEALSQTERTLKTVPKAKNKAIPRTVATPSINIKSPRIAPVKVKVNTQVKIKL